MSEFADHLLGESQRLSEFEQQLESMSPWMAELFSSGQPVFEDEVFEPVFIDDEGSLSAHCELVPAPMREETTEIAQPLDRAWTNQLESIKVPAPRLELGTPWCLLRRFGIFQLQPGALPTELSEVIRATSLAYINYSCRSGSEIRVVKSACY